MYALSRGANVMYGTQVPNPEFPCPGRRSPRQLRIANRPGKVFRLISLAQQYAGDSERVLTRKQGSGRHVLIIGVRSTTSSTVKYASAMAPGAPSRILNR